MAASKKSISGSGKTAPKKVPSKTAAKASAKNTAKKPPERVSNPAPAYIIIMCVITVLLSVFMFVDTGNGGIVSGFVKSALCGAFGVMAYFLPAVMAGTTVYLMRYRKIGRFWAKLILLMLAVVNIAAFIALSNTTWAAAFSAVMRRCLWKQWYRKSRRILYSQ